MRDGCPDEGARLEYEGDAWKWRIQLLAWKWEPVGECCEFWRPFTLEGELKDMWSWGLDSTKGYMVSGIYHLLSSEESRCQSRVTYIIWNKAIPLKVTLFVCLCSVVQSLRRIIWLIYALFQLFLIWVRVVVEALKMLIISFWIVISLAVSSLCWRVG